MTIIRNLQKEMESLLPPDTIALLRTMGRLADREGVPLYLVGGPVRDLLLGRPVLDLDLVAEGDAQRLASILASQLDGHVAKRSQFGTAKLKVEGVTLDIVTARSESYERSGALPTVGPGAIADDLARRDFTINAMAMALSGEGFGQLRDPYGGEADLARRVIRVLHPQSFVDDATRILRALRYEGRLRFRLEPETEGLARRDAHYLPTISGDRIRHELERIFQEARPEEVLARAHELGVLQAILPELSWPPEVHRAVERWRAAGQQGEPLLFAALLAAPLALEAAQALVGRLNLPVRWRRVVLDTEKLHTKLPALQEEHLRPSQAVAILQGLESEAVQAWEVLTHDGHVQERLRAFRQRWRYVRSALAGQDLMALGVPRGPMVGQLLAELRALRLDGALGSREEEEALVRQRLAQQGPNVNAPQARHHK